jgi:ABC-type phosphate transport system substrate-binding protein
MRNTLATLALAAFSALLLSACGGTAAGNAMGVTPGIPNAPAASRGHRAHRLDNGPQDLHAGGADIPGIAYNLGDQPVGNYNQNQTPPGQGSLFYAAPTSGTIYYCITSSTDGREAFEDYKDSGYPPTGPCAPLGSPATGFGGRQDPLDFVGTATALASTECCGTSSPYYENRDEGSVTWGQPFEFPEIGAPIVYAFRPQDFSAQTKTIKLSTWTYCAVANGTISDWNDGAITKDNGQSVTGGTSEPITFYFRSDSAGSTYNFTNHLNAVCNQTFKKPYNALPYGSPSRSAAWGFGVASAWPGPGSSGDPNSNFIGENGDPGILAALQTTPYATGYIVGAYVKQANPKVGQALLQNGSKKGKPVWVNPADHVAVTKAFAKLTAGNITYGGGSDGNPLGSSTPWCQLFLPYSYYDNPPAKSYPIVAVSYLLFYGNNNGVHLSDKTALIKYLESSSANKIVNKLEYSSLPPSISTATLNALNGTASQSACLQ